jgi:hypothetical protein
MEIIYLAFTMIVFLILAMISGPLLVLLAMGIEATWKRIRNNE